MIPALTFAAGSTQYKTISSSDGLSNSAIRCIHQNNLGHIYMGTSDGLNIWDGHTVEIFQAPDGQDWFSGNLIKYLIPFKDNILYLHTRYGIARLDMETEDVMFFKDLAFIYRLAVMEDETLICMDRENRLYSFDITEARLTEIENSPLSEKEYCRRMIYLPGGRLCIFADQDSYIISLSQSQKGKPVISSVKNLRLSCNFVTAADNYNARHHYIMTSDHRLLEFDTETTAITEIAAVNNMPNDHIKGILPNREGYYISFVQEGLYILPNNEDTISPTSITCGILSMIQDRDQPIVWIGTDSNGLIQYDLSRSNVQCLTFESMPHSITMPVRSLLIDKDRTLWFGTKGDGLYRIPDFGDGDISEINIGLQQMQKITAQNSLLCHNSVYAIVESVHGLLWIGTEGNGLNCWSEKTRQIENVEGSESIKTVHAIIEQGNTLYVATDQNSAYRCKFTIKGGIPSITDVEQIKLIEPFNSKTSLYSMAQQNDSIIWFGSRGEGVLAYNTISGQSRVMKFPTTKGLATNDTFFMTKSDRMLFATGSGLMTYSSEDDMAYHSDHIPAKATHGIVCDKDGNIFVSTNSGIISLDSSYSYRCSFDRSAGLEILEYSDGACFYDAATNKVLFGGVNGITIIDSDTGSMPDLLYRPKINITKLIQNNRSFAIGSHIRKGALELPYSKTNFGIRFSVVDNLRYSDYEFYHKIDGYSEEWVENDGDIAYMPTLEPGNYNLLLAYTNKATGYRSEECVLPIRIRPPFYRTWWAYLLYFLIISHIVWFLIWKSKQKYAVLQEKMRKKYSDEITRITSRTTNSINEELSVQMTFIIGLCQQIRQAVSNNAAVADKVNLVEYNVAKINKTLHIFNEFKNISEILINSRGTEFIAVSQTIAEIVNLVKSRMTTEKVTLTHDIEDGINMVLNKEAFLTMLYSLIYKMLSTTTGNKCIDIQARKGSGNTMILTADMTADKATYHKMVAAVREDNTYTEEEYEIVFCQQLITLMNGSMDIGLDTSEDIITIRIILPSLKMEHPLQSNDPTSDTENIYTYNTIIDNQLPKDFKSKAHLEYIYIMSGDRDISSFLGYFMSDGYNILTYSDNESLLRGMEEKCPIAVIYDVHSTTDGFSGFIDSIKGNIWFEQIITIALTSSLQTRERDECSRLGADLCISFPFNMDYLRSMLEKLIQKKRDAARYYKSAMSSYTIDEGKIISQEDKEFLDNILKIIDNNISDPDLTAPMIADSLCISTRVMYRRLEKITSKKLQRIIQEMRMGIALHLISTTNMTIEEIMFKVGYDSRTTFYRNFKEIHGITPGEYRKKNQEKKLLI